MTDDIAWLIFTNTDREKEKFKAIIKIKGDEAIGMRLLEYVTVMSSERTKSSKLQHIQSLYSLR